MVSLPLLWLLLSIDFNRYVGTCQGTEGTSDATFRLFHVSNVVPALVVLARIGQHIFGAERDAQSTALTPLSINYYGSFWHVRALSGSMSRVWHCSTVVPDREWVTDFMISCLGRFVNVLYAAFADVYDSYATVTSL